jgi:tyrosinase
MSAIERKEIRNLEQDQRQKLFDAFLKLKESGKYDKYTEWHYVTMMSQAGTEPPGATARNFAHVSPIFLPWHRAYLIRLEQDLRSVSDDSVSIPYWDWTIDSTLPNPAKSMIWNDDYFGSSNTITGKVETGPFNNWKINFTTTIDGRSITINEFLTRRFRTRTERLPFSDEVTKVIENLSDYDIYPWERTPNIYFRPALEFEIHNPVHRWIDGTMRREYSPGDPIFYLHHCNIDRIWAAWQIKHNFYDKYPADGEIRDTNNIRIDGQNRNDKMWPWKEQNDKVLREFLDFRPYYKYDKLPSM